MNIDIKKSAKPVKYIDAIEFLEKRAVDVNLKKKKRISLDFRTSINIHSWQEI